MDPSVLALLASLGQGGNTFGSNFGNFLGGIFGDPSAPYKKAGKELDRYLPQAQGYQNPFYQAGVGAIPQFQQWLGGMQDPSQFINKMMGQYQESPWAKYEQDQAVRAGQNMGSGTGLTGSSALAQAMQQNAANISSQDMQNWLERVLGVNTQYGAGLGGMIGQGQGAANSLTNLLSDYMTNKANLAYGKESARQGQWGGLFNGLGGMLGQFGQGLFGG